MMTNVMIILKSAFELPRDLWDGELSCKSIVDIQ